MPTIAAHVVRKPRREWGCASCRKVPDLQTHLVLFGMAEPCDRPYRIRICLQCGASTSDPKVKAALASLAELGKAP